MFYAYYEYPSGITEDWQKLRDLSLSYQRAIDTLMSKEMSQYYAEEFAGKSERDIFPILFLMHLYFELSFKAIIHANSKLSMGEIAKFGHDLISLRKKVKEYYP